MTNSELKRLWKVTVAAYSKSVIRKIPKSAEKEA